MERMELYKGFRIRTYEDWSGLWLAETKKPLGRRPGAGDHDDIDAEYIATPSGHPTVPVRVKGQRKCRRQAHNSQQTSTLSV
jgi:hypothetical protein